MKSEFVRGNDGRKNDSEVDNRDYNKVKRTHANSENSLEIIILFSDPDHR